jgi:hypothetical protein
MKHIFLTAAVALLICGCGGNAYLNPSYQFDLRATPKLAIVPILPSSEPLATFLDTQFADFFAEGAKPGRLVSPSSIRKVLESDKSLLRLLSVMGGAEFPKDELKKGASIAGRVNLDDLSRMRSTFGNAEFLLVPRAWNVSGMGANTLAARTFGACVFRLYDLKSGQLIYESSHDVNVNMAGESAVKNISIVLIGFVQEHYKRTILGKVQG